MDSLISKISTNFGQIEQTENNLVLLANLGWFIPGIMASGLMYDILNLAKHDDKKSVDLLMSKFLKSNFKYLQNHVREILPDRADILNECFKCHKRRQYFASTILLLSQADGVCNGSLYTMKHITTFIKKNNIKSFYASIVSTEISINASVKAIRSKNKYVGMSRHAIMHGQDLSYGNELNSLKAFSFLLFVLSFLRPKGNSK